MAEHTSLAADEKGEGGHPRPPDPVPVVEKQAPVILSEDQKRILNTQLDCPTCDVSFLALYRFADVWDCLIIGVSVVCAIAAGAASPLLSVSGQETLISSGPPPLE